MKNLRNCMSSHRIIAIDGPAASGKSSVALALARRLGFSYVNSGAMYRAVTWHVLQRSVDVHEPAAVVAAVEQSRIVCELVDNQSRILIDDHDPTSHLRDDNVNRAVSIVSSIPRVRRILVPRMRECAKANNVVMEGRDIGSVVFPETPFKFYVDASPEVRVQRRRAEGRVIGPAGRRAGQQVGGADHQRSIQARGAHRSRGSD